MSLSNTRIAGTRRRGASSFTGVARVDDDLPSLIRRLRPGDIAVTDRREIQRRDAESLVAAGAGALVITDDLATGAGLTPGEVVLGRAGVVVMQNVDRAMTEIAEGDTVAIVGKHVVVNDVVIGSGARLAPSELEQRLRDAKESIGHGFEHFADETMKFLDDHRSLLTDTEPIEAFTARCPDRHVLLVAGGAVAKNQLDDLLHGSYLGEADAVLVGIESGADLLLAAGRKPDIVIGNFGRCSDEALRCGAPLVLHSRGEIDRPGIDRADELGVDYVLVEAPGEAEDVAVRAAFDAGAELIVGCGSRSLVLDDTDGTWMAPSTFATRMRVGPKLVDASTVGRLHATKIHTSDLVMMVTAAFFTLALITYLSEPLRTVFRSVWSAVQ